MAHIVMAHIVMAHIVMAHIVMAHVVMAHIVMAHPHADPSHGNSIVDMCTDTLPDVRIDMHIVMIGAGFGVLVMAY